MERSDKAGLSASDQVGISDPRWVGASVGPLSARKNWLTITAPPPMFLVSVASKGVKYAVSLLFATLAGMSISVAAKGVMGAVLL